MNRLGHPKGRAYSSIRGVCVFVSITISITISLHMNIYVYNRVYIYIHVCIKNTQSLDLEP